MDKTKNITNELVTAYLEGFYRQSSDSLMQLREEAERNGVPVILRETEDFLNLLLALSLIHI